jgi:uncharacterized membrane protein (DUF2068 family)
MTQPHDAKRGLIWIGGFKLTMGLLLAIVATGILSLIHRDVAEVVEHWVSLLRFDPENRHIASLLEKLDLVEDRQLKQIGGLTFVYSALLLTEGVGLLMKKRWAEFLTVIATGSFIPMEIHEVIKRFGFGRLTIFIINVGIVWFLIRSLRREADLPPAAQSR